MAIRVRHTALLVDGGSEAGQAVGAQYSRAIVGAQGRFGENVQRRQDVAAVGLHVTASAETGGTACCRRQRI